MSTSSIVLATDVLILLMPTWILHDLKMPFARKLMVIAFLSFGVAVTIVGAVRTSVLVKVFVIGEMVPDPTYSVGYTLSNIESGLAIIGTCGPTIKHIFGFCIPRLRTPDESSSRGYNYPPTGGSQGASRSKRYTTGTRNTNLPKDMDKDTSDTGSSTSQMQSNGDIELGSAVGRVRPGKQPPSSDEQLVITKTIAWRGDAAHHDSDSTHEQNVNTPHTVL